VSNIEQRPTPLRTIFRKSDALKGLTFGKASLRFANGSTLKSKSESLKPNALLISKAPRSKPAMTKTCNDNVTIFDEIAKSAAEAPGPRSVSSGAPKRTTAV
jgi:hypothetical protein